MKTNSLSLNDIPELSAPGLSWEMEGADATYAGKVAVIIIVAIIVL